MSVITILGIILEKNRDQRLNVTYSSSEIIRKCKGLFLRKQILSKIKCLPR